MGRWPLWVLILAIVTIASGLGWALWRRRSTMAAGMTARRTVVIWLLQALLASLLLVLLWQPALQISTLKPQQNVVAVIVDDSSSMAIAGDGGARSEQAINALSDGLLEDLSENFQVRTYRMGSHLERIQSLEELTAGNQSTQIGESLKQVVVEAASLPIGAVVLLTDGADNSGGVDLETIGEIRSRRIPVHTIGFGKEQFEQDVEIVDVETPSRALADSQLVARVAFRQNGYEGQKGKLTLRDHGRVLAGKDIEFIKDGMQQSEMLLFNAGDAGAKNLRVSIEILEGEKNPENNAVARLVNVEDTRPRMLYLEGEPRWEFKFIRRALQQDRSVKLVSILRTTQNKIYRQGISEEHELEEGFPGKIEDLFNYQGLILGSVEANYFTTAQQELIRQFVDRRGGGLLFLGGRAALGDGGYPASSFAEMLPVELPDREGTFLRERAGVQLTAAGRESLITRLVEDLEDNAGRWKQLPKLADFQETGLPKPGAVVLAELISPIGREIPLLVTQNYGHGRTAVFATGGSWRWQMQQELTDQTHETFWQQLLRWLVTGTPGQVVASTPQQVLFDESRVDLTAMVRDKTYLPTTDALVDARIMGPEGAAETVELVPDTNNPGLYSTEWRIPAPGAFVAEVVVRRGEEEIGRDAITFRRDDGVAENFRTEQNRELLEKLSSSTGGGYYRPDELDRLSEEISYSEAGITVRETIDLWNMSAIFMVLVMLKAAEWFLRRRWGVV